MVYKGMMLPIMECVFLCGPLVADVKRLQISQNKGLCCALNLDIDTSRDDLHVEANLLTG